MLLAYTHNTPPRGGEYISYNPSLLHNKPKPLHKALVKISAIWTRRNIWSSNYTIFYFLPMNMTIYFYMLDSLMEHRIGGNVNRLSQCMVIGTFTTNFNSSRKCLIHISSHDVRVISLYSAKQENLGISTQ